MTTVAIIQARMGSSRLPGKVMKLVGGLSLIEIMLDRLKPSRKLDGVIVAITDQPADDPLADHLETLGAVFVRGPEHDVLARFILALDDTSADTAVRLTGDCPLIDPAVVDDVIARHQETGVDYTSNVDPPTYPDGIVAEVFRVDALRTSHGGERSVEEREHVTIDLRESGSYSTANLSKTVDHSKERWTVDTAQDLEVVTNVLTHFLPRLDFTMGEVLALCDENPALFEANRDHIRNAGRHQGRGQKRWRRAQELIPQGGRPPHLSSIDAPLDGWPAYFSRAKGARIWDLDGRDYIDMSDTGIGNAPLGYAHPEVDAAVRDVIGTGNATVLNGAEDTELAARLIDLHGFADMAMLFRSEASSLSAALGLARLATGRSAVLRCGTRSRGTGRTVNAKSLKQAIDAIASDPPACIVVDLADPGFAIVDSLRAVVDAANQIGVVVVFDETLSAFRTTLGGHHAALGIEPDIALFGKALGNGYSVSAVIGRRELMEQARALQLAPAVWADRIGTAAALRALAVMERNRSWEKNAQTGLNVQTIWNDGAAQAGIPISISGLDGVSQFDANIVNSHIGHRIFAQSLLEHGVLGANVACVSLAHDEAVLVKYAQAVEIGFHRLKAEIAAGFC